MYNNNNLNWLAALAGANQNQPQKYNGKVQHVHGRGGMEAFTMEPDSSIFLADETEENVVWFKSTDSGGFATSTKFHLVPDEEKTPEPKDYVTKEEFDELAKQVKEITEELK